MEVKDWENTGSELVRTFLFENQSELAEFVMKVAHFSDEVNHHADMEISQCRKLIVRITTHDSNGLTEKDFNWAKTVSLMG